MDERLGIIGSVDEVMDKFDLPPAATHSPAPPVAVSLSQGLNQISHGRRIGEVELNGSIPNDISEITEEVDGGLHRSLPVY